MAAKKTIVIVEDEPDTAEMFGEMLRLRGFQVIKAYSGKPAIEVIRTGKPDAVVLDLMMPDISGLEVLEYLKRDPNLEQIPVIVVSAKGMPEDIRKGLEAGADVYLTKPITFKELTSATERLF